MNYGTYTSEEDLLQPVLALGLTTRENVHVVRGVLKVRQAIGGLHGEDVWLGSLVHAGDVVRVEVVERAQELRVLAGVALREPETVLPELHPPLLPLAALVLPLHVAAADGRAGGHSLRAQQRREERLLDDEQVDRLVRVPRPAHVVEHLEGPDWTLCQEPSPTTKIIMPSACRTP